MGLGFAYTKYMSDHGFFGSKKPRLLDIGSQNLLAATPDDISAFAIKHGFEGDREFLRKESERISYFSTPRAGERTSYVSELFDLTNIDYHSFDICPALKTEIFELNFQDLHKEFHNDFDVVLNFGTTEHILNQYNVFKIMHEATRVGGVMFHQVPCLGWINHGYVCYQSLFFEDIAKCNGYEIKDIWLNPAGISSIRHFNLDIRSGSHPDAKDNTTPLSVNEGIENYNINVVLVKTKDVPFTIPLELLTSHSAPDPKFDAKRGIVQEETLSQEAASVETAPIEAASIEVASAIAEPQIQEDKPVNENTVPDEKTRVLANWKRWLYGR